MMIRKASAMTRHDSIVIQKSGKPVAAIVDIDLFEKIRLMQGEFDSLCGRLAASVKNADPGQVQDELKEAMATVRSPA